MKIEILEVAGLIPAMQALRLPYSREPRSYRDFDTTPYWEQSIDNQDKRDNEHILRNSYQMHINKEDLALASKLIKAGDEHGKILRGIIAYLKISAPLYYWNEMVTYRIGCECLSSSSTMHTITRGITPDMFDCDEEEAWEHYLTMQHLINCYNNIKGRVNPIDVEKQFLKIKRYLPSCFIQTRILAVSYQTLRRIYKQRRNHRLPQWKTFCEAISKLPFANELIMVEKTQGGV